MHIRCIVNGSSRAFTLNFSLYHSSEKRRLFGREIDGVLRDRRDRVHRPFPGGTPARAQGHDLRAGAQRVAEEVGRASRPLGRGRETRGGRGGRSRKAEAWIVRGGYREPQGKDQALLPPG